MSNIFSTKPTSEHTVEEASTMPLVGNWLGRILNAVLYTFAFVTPLVLCLRVSESIEMGKQTVLLVLAAIGLVAWLGKSLADRSLTLVRHWMHVVVGLFGLGYLLSAFLSQDRVISFIGAPGQVVGSFATLAGFIVMYVLIVHSVRTTAKFYDLLLAFLGGSLLVAIVGLIQLAGAGAVIGSILPGFMSTVGTPMALAAYLTVPLLIAVGLVFHGCRNSDCVLGSKTTAGKLAQGLVWLTGLLSFIVLVMVDSTLSWMLILLGSVVMVALGYLRSRSITNPVRLTLPTLLVVVAILLAAFKSPVARSLPAEVTPHYLASFSIAKQALVDNALFGTGPGTWIYDYANYRDRLVNDLPFWNVRFDRGYSTFHTMLATVGIVGIALWLILILSILVKAGSKLMNERDDDQYYAYLTGFTGLLVLVVSSFFTNFGMAQYFAFWLLLSLLTSAVAKNTMSWNKQATSVFAVLSAKLVVVSVAAFALIWVVGQRSLADMRFVSAVKAFRANASIEEVMMTLESAHKLNPLSDVYARNLAQAHLVQAARLIQLNDSKNAQKINNSIKSAVDYGRIATEINPRNADNWSNLALMYQSIARFVQRADEEAIKNFQEASKREPQNPVYLTEIGRMHLARADAYRQNLNSQDAVKKAEATEQVPKELALAEDFLKKAVQAKVDFLPARYQMAIVYERQNKLKDSIAQLEAYLSKNTQDVGVGFEYAIVLYRDGQKDKSLQALKTVVQLAPDNVNARWFLSAFLEEKGQYAEAIAILKPVADKYPDNDAVKQRLNVLTTAQASKEAPKPQQLPEPIQESIQTQQNATPVKP